MEYFIINYFILIRYFYSYKIFLSFIKYFSYLPSTLLSSRLVRLRVDMSEKEEVLARAELVLFSLITAWYFFMPRLRELADAGVESFVWQHSHRGVLATTLPSEQIFLIKQIFLSSN